MKSPCFQFYTKEFLGSTFVQSLDDDAVGVYVKLLVMQWEDESIPNNEDELAHRFPRTTRERFGVIWARLKEKFVARKDDRLINLRLDAERKKQKRFSRMQKEKADAMWQKRKGIRQSSGNAGAYAESMPARAPARQTQTQRSSSESETDRVDKPAPKPEPREPGAQKRLADKWRETTGALLVDPQAILAVGSCIAAYAEAAKKPLAEVQDQALSAFKRHVRSWTAPQPLTPALFLRKWDEIQVEMVSPVQARASPTKSSQVICVPEVLGLDDKL